MPLFTYQAFTKDGKKAQGTLDAPTIESAKAILQQQSLYIIKLEYINEQAAHRSLFSFIFHRSVSMKDKIIFTKQLAVLLRSGVPLMNALDLLIEQFSDPLRSIIISLRDGIKEGKSLAQGMAQYGRTFDTIYIQLVRAGEATGKLETVLERLIEYMEQREEIKAKITGALRYPMIQLGMVTLIVIGLLTFVLPVLAGNLTSEKTALPFSTAFLLGLSHIITNYWYFLLIGLIALILLFRYWRSTPTGAYQWDALKLKMPIIGFFTRMGAITQFSRTLSILIESGVNLTESLDIVVKIIDNRVLAESLKQARDKIIKQGRIAEFLAETHIFPKIATYLINTGEQSGQLDTMLLTVAQNYEKEVSEYAQTLAAILDPIMMVIVGGVVGFVVMSVIQPIMQQSQSLSI